MRTTWTAGETVAPPGCAPSYPGTCPNPPKESMR
jgi:hypothetical protein